MLPRLDDAATMLLMRRRCLCCLPFWIAKAVTAAFVASLASVPPSFLRVTSSLLRLRRHVVPGAKAINLRLAAYRAHIGHISAHINKGCTSGAHGSWEIEESTAFGLVPAKGRLTAERSSLLCRIQHVVAASMISLARGVSATCAQKNMEVMLQLL
jgi:hypothetical protein